MRASRFTTSEAAFLAGLDVRAVNKIIDLGVVAAQPRGGSDRAPRRLGMGGVVCLRLERDLAPAVTLSVRRRMLDLVARQPRLRELREGCALVVDVRGVRRELARQLVALRGARRLVERDPGVLGGEPVFKGTRVPVHSLAEMLRRGADAGEILDGHPRLTPEMLALAPVYAAAYPRRGRPPGLRKELGPPSRTARYPLDGLDTSPGGASVVGA